jgi:hypothetical protein
LCPVAEQFDSDIQQHQSQKNMQGDLSVERKAFYPVALHMSLDLPSILG